ncbi:CotH kinase family protein, partial [Streptomyces sp. NPDC054865]
PGGNPGGTPGGDPGGTPGGTPGGEPGGTPGGAPGGNPGGTPGGSTGNGDGSGGAGNVPVPNGGLQPIGDQPSGELASTGGATGWALNGAGLTVALGAALAAGTGRHRRRTT